MRNGSTRTLSCAALLMSTASAQFGPQQSLVDFDGPTDFEFMDLDGDEDLDLVVCGIFSRSLFSYENLGNGTFGPGRRLVNEGGGSIDGLLELESVDFDGDGLLDVVAVAAYDNKLSGWRSNGDGTFAIEKVISTGIKGAAAVIAADVDDDGDMDLLTSAFYGDEVGLHINLGGGAFAPRAVVTTEVGSPRGLAAADLDDDGVLDLVICSRSTDILSWHRGLGGGIFDARQVILSGGGAPAKVAVADLDRDGKLDLLVSFLSGDILGWFRNTGGSFGALQELDGSADTAFGLAVEDFDYDGDLDVASTNLIRNEVRVYENLGGGAFGPPVSLAGLNGVWAVSFIDIDGDQDFDVVSSARYLDGISFYRNETTIGDVYCTSNPNSTGSAGTLSVTGASDVAFERLALQSTYLPPFTMGYFLGSQTQGMISMPAGNDGILCLGGSVGRFITPEEIQSSGPEGRFSLVLDVNQIAQPMTRIAIQPGSTWNFQAWYRDDVLGAATSNFTDAATVTFWP